MRSDALETLNRTTRQTSRHLALNGLSVMWRTTGRIERALSRPRVHFIYLHDIPLVDEANFLDLVQTLAKTHTFLKYSDAVDRLRNGPIDRPYLCFSFDDGFASNQRAARILEDHGTTACLFIPPGFVGTQTVAEAEAYFRTPRGVNEPALTWADLDALKARGHEIGGHTMRHFNLRAISPDQVVSEIVESTRILSSRFGSCDHFAWPLGRFENFTPHAAAVTYSAGYLSCASAERGAHTHTAGRQLPDLCIRRDHIVASWPLRHCLYFIARSSAGAGPTSNTWPDGWTVPL